MPADNQPDHTERSIARLERELAALRAAVVVRKRRRLPLWVAAFGLVFAGSVVTANAQSIADKLIVFGAGQPAVADDVNWNFNLLKTWLEAKVGTAGQQTTIDTTGSISAGSFSAKSGSAAGPGERHGIAFTGSTDPLFIGQESRAAGNDSYDAVIAWGDNTDDKLRFESNQCCGNGDRSAMTLDYAGNATFAGKVTATDLEITGNAFGSVVPAAVNTPYVAQTNGFVMAHILADNDGDRCLIIGKHGAAHMVSAAVHWYSRTDANVYRNGFTMPVPAGVTWRVDSEDSAGVCAKTVQWIPWAP